MRVLLTAKVEIVRRMAGCTYRAPACGWRLRGGNPGDARITDGTLRELGNAGMMRTTDFYTVNAKNMKQAAAGQR